MASVGGPSAYAVRLCTVPIIRISPHMIPKTDIIAVQRVLYKQQYNFSCPTSSSALWYCLTDQRAFLFMLYRSVVSGNVHAIDGVLRRRFGPPVSSRTPWHDMAE